jgi:hypothetical protein
MKRFLLFVLLIDLFAIPRASCQNPNTPWLPVGLNGETGPIGTLAESGENELSLGVTAGGSYYGNSYANSTGQGVTESYTVQPDISITERRPRISWTLQYSPGFSYTRQTGDQLIQTSLGSLQYRIAERLTLQISERYLHMNSWFTGLDVNPTATAGNVVQQPNESILTTETVATTSFTTLNLVYQVSDSTVVGMGSSFNRGSFSNVPAAINQPLFNSERGTASAYVSHRVYGNNWLGITGTFQRIVTGGGIKEGADNSAVQLFYTFAPSAHTSLSLFAGPSYFTSQAETEITVLGIPIPITIPTKGWGANGGATVGWRGERMGVSARYTHRISDGGGLTGASHSDSAAVNFRRQLSEHWTANVAGMYGHNNSVSILYGSSFQTISGTASLNWRLTNNLSVTLSYARDHLQSSYHNLLGSTAEPTGLTTQAYDPNRVWASISYHFTRPLGW